MEYISGRGVGRMSRDELAVNALVISAHIDMKRGLHRDDILNSLSNLISKDLYKKVKERL